ncbi:UNVERIFIED_CONTAM: hypothetical protein FKN15_053408 [Acipenser sinensis]
MEDSVITFLEKTLQRIPSSSLKSILNEWGFLSAQQLQDLHFQQSKHILHNKVLAFCEVSIGMKQFEDDAVWIRVAWGDNFTKPNQFKPTYVVYQLQTPYVFISNLNVKHRPLLSQSLVIATKHDEIKEIQLRGRSLKSLKDLVLRRYKQVYFINPRTLARPHYGHGSYRFLKTCLLDHKDVQAVFKCLNIFRRLCGLVVKEKGL